MQGSVIKDMAAGEYGKLWGYPKLSAEELRSSAVQIGISGECLVKSILTRHGVPCYFGGDHLGSDIRIPSFIGDISVRVKTTTAPRLGYYRFFMRRGNPRTKAGVRAYDSAELAIAALVILPLNAVCFTSDLSVGQSIHTSEVPCLLENPKATFINALAALAKRHRSWL